MTAAPARSAPPRAGAAHGLAVDALPGAVEDQVDHGWPIRDRAWRSAGSKRGIVLDPHASGAECARRGGKVDRPEVRRDRRGAGPAFLVGPDHAVALVVEDEDDAVRGRVRDRGLD